MHSPRACRAIRHLALVFASTSCTPSAPPIERVPVHAAPPVALAQTSSPAPNLPEPPNAYPHGAWRRATRGELSRTVFWLSHILIRHNRVDSEEVPFTVTGWLSTQPPATRTPDEALALANQLAQTARQHGNFEALARLHSEDPARRSQGGSIGGVVALHFTTWPNVLDAVTALRPGDISNVVSTEYGYHVLARRAPVPEATVSGAHIVIAHADAPWIQMAARHKIAARSRDEALAIAAGLYERARRNPAEFPRLVASHSDHRDAAIGGDMGSWSTREPSGYPREIETLSQLEVGEVAEPIDSIFGVQVILRTPNPVRKRYAATQVYLPFDTDTPESDPMSKAAVFRRARAVAELLRKEPARFRGLQEELCCTDLLEIVEGRHPPALVSTLESLSPGQIADTPVEDAAQYTIPKRLGLDVLPPAGEALFELP